ncbi:Zinc finger CCCH domain-containing protein 62 [Apostasia shenzhenica]|uniref:Zinc finger CCCH domain-containing protein 62 n=1 Tax=Apostasia shenzhenica TaxID=1088818 RepID=A0A2I0ASQ7_9ASPA|nr:Zinc finger CCCH domain-containing protein 62 [Apostasia shenzhenica]
MARAPLLSPSLSSANVDTLAPAASPATTKSFSDHYSTSFSSPYKLLAVLSGHAGAVSSLALCGEFLLSASVAQDIIAWQHPDLRPFTRFGHGDGSVKALVAAGNRLFTAHQDRRIRVWKVSRRPGNAFRLVATLPTARDYLLRIIKRSSFIQTRRHHRRLWIEHADSISCLAVGPGVIYSGSWDKTLKVWRASDLKCIESIAAHDDAINALVAHKGILCSASADGKIRIWAKGKSSHCLRATLVSRKEVSWNAVVVSDEGGFVYGGGSDGGVMGWEIEGPRVVCHAMEAHAMAVLCLCTTAGFVFSGSADNTIGVWRREKGGGLERLGTISGHEGPVKCLQASWRCVGGGGGFMLYSGGLDKSLRVWWLPKEYGGEGEMREEMEKCIMVV